MEINKNLTLITENISIHVERGIKPNMGGRITAWWTREISCHVFSPRDGSLTSLLK